MANDWEEVKRLAADFQRAQLSSTVQRLTERNCIEIVSKLIKERMIEVYHTSDGKEYVTPKQLLREIKDELCVQGGRVHVSDLSRALDIDYAHVEAKSFELVKTEKDVYLVLGQLIDRGYLDRIFEEINEKLQLNGQLSIAELTKQYDLPPDFLHQMLKERWGTVVKGQIDPADSNIIFTQAFVARHHSRVKGALLATTKPTHVSMIINRYGLQAKIFFNVLEELLSTGMLNGNLSGGKSEKAGVFIPDIYAKAQNEWVDNFYKQNRYLEYDALSRLGIGDPENFIRRKFNKESIKYLDSCAVEQTIIDQVEGDIETTVANGTWVDVTTLCPSFFNEDDVQQVVQIIVQNSKQLHDNASIHCDVIVASNQLIHTLAQPFQELMVEKAEDARKKGSFNINSSGRSGKSTSSIEIKKENRKEERRKKASSGKGISGTQGRETKTKSTKKKYMKGKGSEDESEDDSKEVSRPGEIPFMTVSEIEKELSKQKILEDSPEQLINVFAETLYGPLRQKYQEIARSIFMGSLASNSGSRKSHGEIQEKVNGLMANIQMFKKGIDIFEYEELKLELRHYLLRTIGSNIVNLLVGYIAQENMLSSEVTENMTPEQRVKLIGRFSTEIRTKFTTLNTTLNGKSIDEFLDACEPVLSSDICDIILKKLDKKKEKLNASNQLHSLQHQLSESAEPALVLHLAMLIIFSKATNQWISASGKFVPQILEFLHQKGHLEEETYQLLRFYQELIVKHVSSMKTSEDHLQPNEELESKMTSIKEAAINFRSKTKSNLE